MVIRWKDDSFFWSGRSPGWVIVHRRLRAVRDRRNGHEPGPRRGWGLEYERGFLARWALVRVSVERVRQLRSLRAAVSADGREVADLEQWRRRSTVAARPARAVLR